MALNIANVELTDTFNTWRVRTNSIIAEAVSANSTTPTTITTITTFSSNTTLDGSITSITSNTSLTGANVDITSTVDINSGGLRVEGDDVRTNGNLSVADFISVTGNVYANSFSGDGSSLTDVDAQTLDSIDSGSFLRSDTADAKTSGDLTFNDNIKALFGTAGDLEIFHNGSDSIINDEGGGNLIIQLGGGGKMEFTAAGADFTGALTATGNITANAFIGDGSQLTNAGSTVAVDGGADRDLSVVFTGITSGTMTTANVSSVFTFNPSSGEVDATDFNSTSDENLKENIQTLNNSLEKVLQLRGVSFNWKESGESSVGMIAQEVEEIVPEVVSTRENGFKSIGYGKLIGLLIEAIKEQQETINKLKS